MRRLIFCAMQRNSAIAITSGPGAAIVLTSCATRRTAGSPRWIRRRADPRPTNWQLNSTIWTRVSCPNFAERQLARLGSHGHDEAPRSRRCGCRRVVLWDRPDTTPARVVEDLPVTAPKAMASMQLNDDVRHLLASFPEDAERHEPSVILDGLVMRTMVALYDSLGPSGLLNQEQVTREVNASTGLAFGSDEIQQALERLEGAGKLTFTDQANRSISVPPHALETARREVLRRRDVEHAAASTWVQGFSARHPNIKSKIGRNLWSQLREAFGYLANARSAEAAALLYLDQPDARETFERLLGQTPRVDDLPLQGSMGISRELFRAEFARLILKPTGAETRFLLSVLSAAFQYHLIALDPGAARLAKSVVGSKVFYLDTNFLFRLLALHGPREAHAPGLIVDLAGEIATDLRVARATVNEFTATVKYHADALRHTLLSRADFRRIAIDHTGNDLNFMSEFYRQQHSGLVTGLEDFTIKCLQIERALEDWRIAIDEHCTWDDDMLAELTERYRRLRAWSPTTKSDRSCEHDILLEHYVRGARTVRSGGLNDVDVWFLTYDRRLTRFAFANPIDDDAPAPLLADDWLQVVRRFSPRTEEYDRAFLGLLSSPLLIHDDALPQSQVVGALRKLEKYEGLGERVVAGMVVEREFVRAINQPLSSGEERRLVKLAIAEASSRLEMQVADAKQQATQAEDGRDIAEQKLRKVRSELGDAQDRAAEAKMDRDFAETRLQKVRMELDRTKADYDLVLREREAEVERAESVTVDRDRAVERAAELKAALEREGRSVRMLRASSAILVGLLVLAAVLVLWTPALVGGSAKWRVFLIFSGIAVWAATAVALWRPRSLWKLIPVLALAVALLQFLFPGG